VLNHWQKVSETAHGDGFARPSGADEQHTSDARVDHGKQQGHLHLCLTDYRKERELDRIH
jgi:hypothetical protein